MNNTPIILDTTYVLPLFGVQVLHEPAFQEEMKVLWENGIKDCKIYLPSVCLVEVMYILNAEYRKKNDIDILNRYPLILPTVLNSPIEIFDSLQNIQANHVAMKIHHAGHPDLMDCWIAGSAAATKGILITEDGNLTAILKSIPETKNTTVLSWKLFQKQESSGV
ncbi:MAG: PIN domain-containing protein [Candidatus Hodarchaeota archaeon]